MKISIIGTGYVGLVTGACLAEKGHQVTCVDLDPSRVRRVNRAESPLFERGLGELLRRNVPVRLRATTDLARAVLESEVTFIAVGTPFNGRTIDLSAVLGAARQIGAALRQKRGYHVVVVKSTVVPGTTDRRVRPALERASGKRAGPDFGVGMNPEFLSEGEAVSDFLHPDRIVLGGIDARTIAVLDQVYRPFARAPRLRTNTRTAELIKYASNALLANLVSFSNELANLGSALGGIDYRDVVKALSLSQYFRGRNREGLPPITAFLQPGCGFGGSCLPKDVKALMAHGRAFRVPMRLLEAVMRVNESQADRMIALLRQHLPDLHRVRVTVLGLSFKPGTDDLRESPAIPVVRELRALGARVRLYDPVAMPSARKSPVFRGARFARTLSGAVAGCRAVLLVTAWPEFRQLRTLLQKRRHSVVVVDGRRLLDKNDFARYAGIGLGPPRT